MNGRKAVCFTMWFSTHNNPRYAELFPQLTSVVQFYKITFHRPRLIRGLEFRLWRLLRKQIYRVVLRRLSRRYETLFTTDPDQVRIWPRENSVVVDADDPMYSPAEAESFNLSQVKGIIVTTEKAKSIFRQLDVTRPIHVIPQGVLIGQVDVNKVKQISSLLKSDQDVVVGYHAPTLTLSCDGPRRARQGQDDLDLLFESLELARNREPRLKLWLLGEASKSVEKYVADGRESWIKLLGYIPLSEIMAYIMNFDIGVYPRIWSPPPGRFSVKIAQFMGCGIPIVSTDLDEAFILKEGKCGIICTSSEQFSNAIVDLAQSLQKRADLGKAGQEYATMNLDWTILVQRYKQILTV